MCLPVNSTGNLQPLDVREYIREEVIAEALFFVLVEMESFEQIGLGKVENLKPHRVACQISFFACSQSMKCAFPSAIKCSL